MRAASRVVRLAVLGRARNELVRLRALVAVLLCTGIASAAPPGKAAPPPPPASAVEPVPAWPPPAAPRAVDAARAGAEWNEANALAPWPVSASIAFGRIAQNPMHPSHGAAVARLGALARELGNAATLERFFTGVQEATLQQQAESGAVLLLAARNRYDQRLFDDAVRFAAKVDRREPEYPAAQLLASAANVQLRRGVPAVQAAQRALQWTDEAPPSRDRAWLRDVALLAIARIHGAAAVRLDENDLPVVSALHLSAAVKFYEKVEPTSALFSDAARELAWSFALAGDHVRASGLGRWLSSAAASSPYAVDGDAVRAASALAYCDVETARLATRQLRARATALQARLGALVTATTRDDAWLALVATAREGRLEPDVTIEIGRADRGLTRRLQYLARIDAEARVAPPGALAVERARVVAEIAAAVRGRVTDTLANLAARLEDARRLEGAAASTVDAQEAAMMNLRPRDRELDPWANRLPFTAPRYESALFQVPMRFSCAR